MSRRGIILLVASVIAGVASTPAVSTDALAAHRKVHPRVVAVAAPAPVIDNYGPIADRIPKCFDSAVYYPLPPCY
jgi:hypothetical protein